MLRAESSKRQHQEKGQDHLVAILQADGRGGRGQPATQPETTIWLIAPAIFIHSQGPVQSRCLSVAAAPTGFKVANRIHQPSGMPKQQISRAANLSD
jgi:hypothetical protein